MAKCAHCGESIESGESYGFRVRPIGNIEQLKGVFALMVEARTPTGLSLRAGTRAFAAWRS
jgi:hypothetical protein